MPRDHLEQEFRTCLRERHVVQLVDDQELELVERRLQAKRSFLITQFSKLADEASRRNEAGRHAHLASCEANADGQVVLPSFDKSAAKIY